MTYDSESLLLFGLLFSPFFFLEATLIYMIRALKPSLTRPVARVYKQTLCSLARARQSEYGDSTTGLCVLHTKVYYT